MRIRYSIVFFAGLLGCLLLAATHYLGGKRTIKQENTPGLLDDINMQGLTQLGHKGDAVGRLKNFEVTWNNRGLVIHVKGESFDPLEEPGMVEILNPRFRIELKQNRVLEVQGEKGHIKLHRVKHPEKGTFFGPVTVRLLQNELIPDKLIAGQTAPENSTLTSSQTSRTRTLVRAQLEDGAQVDLQLGRLISQSRLVITSSMLELFGHGMDVQYNDQSKRITRLFIKRGELLKVNSSKQARADLENEEKDRPKESPKERLKNQTTDKPKEQPSVTNATDTASQKTAAAPELYQLTFKENVAISSEYGWASGTELMSIFDLNGWLNQSPEDKSEKNPKKHVASNASDTESVATARAKTEAAIPRLITHDTPISSESLFLESPQTLALKWTGQLVFLPLNQIEQSEVLSDVKDWSVMISGSPVLAGDKKGRQAKALSLDFSGQAQRILISGNARHPVEINDPSLGKLTGEEISFDGQSGFGSVHGKGTLERSQSHFKRHTHQDKETKTKSSHSKQKIDGRIRWSKGLKWQIRSTKNKKPAKRPATKRASDAPSPLRQMENLVLTKADIEGDVTVQHRYLSLASDKLSLEFQDHPDETQLKHISAIGQVKARSTNLDRGQPELAIDAHRLDLNLFQDHDGDTRLERIYATSSNERGADSHRVYARRPDESILCRQIEVFLQSPGEFPPLRHPSHIEYLSRTLVRQAESPIWPPLDTTQKRDNHDQDIDVNYVRASGDVDADVKPWQMRFQGDEILAQLKPQRRVSLTGGEKPARIERHNMMLLAAQVTLDEDSATIHCPGPGLAAFDDARTHIEKLLSHTMTDEFQAATGTSELEHRLNSFRLLNKASLMASAQNTGEFSRGGWLRWQEGMLFNSRQNTAQFKGNIAAQMLEHHPIKNSAQPNQMELIDRKLVSQKIGIQLSEMGSADMLRIHKPISAKPKLKPVKKNGLSDSQAQQFSMDAMRPLQFREKQLAVNKINAYGQTELVNENWHQYQAREKKLSQRLRLTGHQINCSVPERLVDVDGAGTLTIQDYQISQNKLTLNKNAQKKRLDKTQQPAQKQVKKQDGNPLHALRFKGKGDTELSWQGHMRMNGRAFSIQMNDSVRIKHTEAAIQSTRGQKLDPKLGHSPEPQSYQISSHVFFADFDATKQAAKLVKTNTTPKAKQSTLKKQSELDLGFSAENVELSRIIARGSADGTTQVVMSDGINKILADNLIYDHVRQGAILRSQINPYMTVTLNDEGAFHARRILWDLLSGQIHILEQGPTLLTNGR